MMDQPEARNRERDGSVPARRLEPGEERAIEGPFAWAKVAGDEIALAPAMGQPRILKKAAMDEARGLS